MNFKKLFFVIFCLNLFLNLSKAQNFLNGSFECNTASTCDYNLGNAAFTAKVANTTAFGGGGELDIFQASCGYGTVQHGNWKVGVATPGGVSDAFTMMLNAPLVAGNTYTIQFYDYADPTYLPGVPIRIGVSTVAGALGTIVYTGPIPTASVWTARIFSFVSPNNGQYISVSSPGPTRWTHIDNFSFLGGATGSLTVSSNTVVCNGAPTTLTVSGGTSYTWSPTSSLSTGTGSNVIASPSVTTTYTVLSSSSGCAGVTTSSAIVTVSVSPSPTLIVSPSTTICAGNSATLTVSGATSYTWNPASSLSSASSATVIATPTVNTTYTVIGSNGTCTSSATTSVTIGAGTSLTISPTTTICSGSSATLTVNGASSYTWSPASSLSSTSLATVVATPSSSTTYTVIGVTGTCTNVATTTVSVTSNPTLAISPSNTICIGSSTTLTVSGAASYTWSPAGSLSSTSLATVVATPIANTTYTVIGANSSCTASITTSITVAPNPTLTISPSSTICSGSSATLSASGALTYTWSPASTLSNVSASVTIASPAALTTYSVSGTNAAGCISNTTVLVDVITAPSVTITSVGTTTICQGNAVTLQASGASGYLWSPSGSLSSSAATNVIASPTITTLYTLIGNNGTCTDSKNIQVTVIPIIVPIISSNTVICLGQSTKLTASGGNIYSWSPSVSLSSSVTANVIAKPTSTTIYTVVISNGGICPQTANVQVIVNPLPYVYAGRDTTINIDENVTLVGTGDGIVGFNPLNGEPLHCNYCSTITVEPKETTCYRLYSINNFGCENTDDVCVTVTKDYAIYIPNAFTPNGDIDNELFYPQGYGIESYELLIFDRWGTQIFKSSAEKLAWDGRMNGKVVEQGVYVYKITVKTMAKKEITKTGHVTLLAKSK